jgi:hypothetical protein
VTTLSDGRFHSEANRHLLEPDRRYSLVKIGAALFAYSDFGRYLRALGQAWQCGLVLEPLPSALGRELRQLAAGVRGVDADLTGLGASDLDPRT